KILTSKAFGIPIMLLMLGAIFWITIAGANYPSELLSTFFGFLEEQLRMFMEFINAPIWLTQMLLDGVFRTGAWVVSVMLPPMAIFFPLFTLLEDVGYLPRVAFNMDKFFKKANAHGKQALSMCMGFGCNACGVMGCRIIDSPRERFIAILTNSFVPCNGRLPQPKPHTSSPVFTLYKMSDKRYTEWASHRLTKQRPQAQRKTRILQW
ncbi:MAG TPA: ferrous iron transporter B, partial [Candidatus Scatavimonas merdigallinarum]|nr:ferrous iron transporter B [Candidatus Scatavimonas merdigallinarum]